MENKRIVLLDELRGFALIGMIVYHFLYTLLNIFGVAIGNIGEDTMRFSQPIFAGVFILIAGFSCRLSKNNYKRGLQILFFGIGISVFTFFVIPEQLIIFGILHFLGVSIILFEVCQKWLDKISWKLSFIVLFIIFFVTFNLSGGIINLPFFKGIVISAYTENWFMFLGLPVKEFYSADYFPLLPWFALFLIGTIFGRYANKNKLPDFCYGNNSVVLSWLGKRSLIIYLVHQPLILMILCAVFLFVKHIF